MNSTEIIGASGGIISIIMTIIYVTRKVLKSRCVRNNEGNLVLELGLNTEEVRHISQDQQLKTQIREIVVAARRSSSQERVPEASNIV